MNKKERAELVCSALKEIYPKAACALHYDGDDWKLLVMGCLSAQCTDYRVNVVSIPLFAAYPTMQDMANAKMEDLENLIRPCGLYHRKAENLIKCAQILIKEYDGKIPHEIENLVQLPGIGRKIANLLRGDLWGCPAIVTDTHCIRVCGRLGFYKESEKNPTRIEKELSLWIPPEESADFCHRIVEFGRETCRAQNPNCAECSLGKKGFCFHKEKEDKRWKS